jgi:hypothetical protein
MSSDIWSVCSPDLNRDFLRGCLKDKIYKGNPWTEELKENIHREIVNISAEQLKKE